LTTEKKNQHYIPKFYLRNFSYLNNKKQIGIYNIENSFFYSKSKLKTQGSKNFFYGKDGIIEDNLSLVEVYLAKSINTIISNFKLPKRNCENYQSLLSFVALTDLRSPVSVKAMNQMYNSMEASINELDASFLEKNPIPERNDQDIIEGLLSMASTVVDIIYDLEVKLLINETKTPFISSDFPIVKYNQYLEGKTSSSTSGFGVKGLQIIFPINDKLSIILFDNSIYKIGNKRDNYLIIKSEKDVDSLNLLQFVNCLSTIYFNEKVSEGYIKKLDEKSKKFKRANQGKSESSYLVKEGENLIEVKKTGKNLLIMNSSNCETKLNITGIKKHSKGKTMKIINPNQLREQPELILRMKKN
jgi:hypothetical protein